MSISSVNSNFPTSKFVGKVLTKKLTLQHNSPIAVTSLCYTSVDKPFFIINLFLVIWKNSEQEISIFCHLIYHADKPTHRNSRSIV